MKKLVNLIALVMLVSTNVLTPFSYAQEDMPGVTSENEVETVEEGLGEAGEITEISKEISELNSERKGELGQENQDNETPEDVLPDIQNDVETPSTDETENVDAESREVVQPLEETPENEIQDESLEGDETEDEFLLQKEDEAAIIQVQPGTTATLLPGKQFNVKLKKLSGQSNVEYYTTNTTIEQIIYTGTMPSGVTTTGISTVDSERPVYAWFTGGTIYYTSEAETIYMNPNSSYMFYDMEGLTGMDLSILNTSRVTNMSQIFYECYELESLDLSKRDTRSVTNMSQMFYDCYSLESLDLSKRDTRSVTDMRQMFYDCYSLESLDLSKRDTSNVTNMSNMFRGCYNLETIYVDSGFVTNQITSNYIFGNNTKLVGGNGTVYSDSKTDKTYANIDSQSQSGYFTSKDENLSVRFIVYPNIYETSAVQFGQKVSRPTNDPSKTGFEFVKWVGADGKEYDFNTQIKKYTEIYAIFDGNETILLPGKSFNQTLKKLIGYDYVPSPNYEDSKIKQILQWTGNSIPDGIIDTKIISAPYSDNDVVSWYDDGIIYYYTEAEKIYMNPDSSQMFSDMNGLIYIDMSEWNTSNVINMNNMFYDCDSLSGLDLSRWDTKNVITMSYMFYNCDSFTGLDLSSWDTSNVENMFYMFYGDNLEYLNLNGWDFRKIGRDYDLIPYIYYIYNGDSQLKKLDMESAKFTGGMRYAFEYLTKIEEISLSGADVSSVTDMSYIFPSLKNLKKLDISNWDTKNVTKMHHMFYNCSNLEEIKGINKLNTSKVTDINSMFWSDAKLTGLDLGGWDTSNVTSVSSMFYNCTGLLELNMSGWDFSKIGAYYGLSDNMSLNSYRAAVPLKKWDMTNTKFSGSMTYAFYGLRDLEELILDGIDTTRVTSMNSLFNQSDKLTSLDLSSFDTSGVTDMYDMFYYCSGLVEIKGLETFDTTNVTSMGCMFEGCTNLTGLDLGSFDTSKVTNMSNMFYNTPNLKTIYASDKFVTTALTGNYRSGSNMFYNSVNLVGGNGTKFDSGYTDKTYALIDKVGQTGYFTDKNAINVKFINTLDGTETLATFAKGQKLTPPYVDKYHVVGGYLDEEMKQAIDLNKGVDSYSVIYVKYERNGSSGGGGGGGGGGGATKPDTPKEEQEPAESPQSDVSTGTTVKEPESSTGNKAEIQTGSQQPLSPLDSFPDREQIVTPLIEGDGEARGGGTQSYSPEFQEAYEFAHENGITTKDTIQSAQMNGKLTRIAMAKMLSQYAINVLGKEPDVSKGVVKFNDVTSKKDADYDNGVTLAYQLGIMGQNMPGNNFRPNDEVTRAEFATALSRMAYGTSDGEYEATSKYYIHHMERLVKEGIITKDDPNMKELRGYVMIMLMRSAEGG